MIEKIKLNEIEISRGLSKAMSLKMDDNLRDRSHLLKIDTSLRGFLCEIAFEKWCNYNNIRVTKGGFDKFLRHDIDFKCNEVTIDVKSSMVPSSDKGWDDIIKRDIKLTKGSREPFLLSEIYAQFYIYGYTKSREKQLSEIKSFDAASLYELLKLDVYKESIYFVSWVSKPKWMQWINKQPKKTYSMNNRDFWKCPMDVVGSNPCDLAYHLNNISNT